MTSPSISPCDTTPDPAALRGGSWTRLSSRQRLDHLGRRSRPHGGGRPSRRSSRSLGSLVHSTILRQRSMRDRAGRADEGSRERRQPGQDRTAVGVDGSSSWRSLQYLKHCSIAGYFNPPKERISRGRRPRAGGARGSGRRWPIIPSPSHRSRPTSIAHHVRASRSAAVRPRGPGPHHAAVLVVEDVAVDHPVAGVVGDEARSRPARAARSGRCPATRGSGSAGRCA